MYGYALGGYWTRKGGSGWYVDGVLQGARSDMVETWSIWAEKFSTDGWGIAPSLEGGHPIELAPGWALEPQAQLIYQWTKLEGGDDSIGRMSFGDTSASYGRIGTRLTSRIAQRGGQQGLTAWARLNIWHAFDARTTTTFRSLQGTNAVALSQSLGAPTWAQVGVGLSGQIARNTSAFGSVDYNRSLGGDEGYGWSGRVGVRFQWNPGAKCASVACIFWGSRASTRAKLGEENTPPLVSKAFARRANTRATIRQSPNEHLCPVDKY